MNLVHAVLALSLVGAEGETSAKVPAPPIAYQVRVLEMKGLEWRAAVLPQLTAVTRQGSAMVWTTGREVVETLVGKAAREVSAPRLVAASEAPAHVNLSNPRTLATRMSLASTPKARSEDAADAVVAVAYSPECETIRDKFLITITGRKLDQGVLTRVVAEDAQIMAVHSVKMPCSTKAPCDSGDCPEPQAMALDVPEVCRATVEGEWMVPNQGVLLVSFGAHTVADDQGKAVVKERLMVVEAKPVDPMMMTVRFPAAVRLPAIAIQSDAAAKPVPPAPAIPMPMPTPPSRHLPQPVNADGKPVALPPLPDDSVTPTSIPGTSEPCASPQTRIKTEGGSIDPNTVKSSHGADVEAPPKAPSPVPTVPGKPISFRVPLNGKIQIEIHARAIPAN